MICVKVVKSIFKEYNKQYKLSNFSDLLLAYHKHSASSVPLSFPHLTLKIAIKEEGTAYERPLSF